jgi:hypothetical protein
MQPSQRGRQYARSRWTECLTSGSLFLGTQETRQGLSTGWFCALSKQFASFSLKAADDSIRTDNYAATAWLHLACRATTVALILYFICIRRQITSQWILSPNFSAMQRYSINTPLVAIRLSPAGESGKTGVMSSLPSDAIVEHLGHSDLGTGMIEVAWEHQRYAVFERDLKLRGSLVRTATVGD